MSTHAFNGKSYNIASCAHCSGPVLWSIKFTDVCWMCSKDRGEGPSSDADIDLAEEEVRLKSRLSRLQELHNKAGEFRSSVLSAMSAPSCQCADHERERDNFRKCLAEYQASTDKLRAENETLRKGWDEFQTVGVRQEEQLAAARKWSRTWKAVAKRTRKDCWWRLRGALDHIETLNKRNTGMETAHVRLITHAEAMAHAISGESNLHRVSNGDEMERALSAYRSDFPEGK